MLHEILVHSRGVYVLRLVGIEPNVLQLTDTEVWICGGSLCSTAPAATNTKKETGQIGFSVSLYNILHLRRVSYNEASRRQPSSLPFVLAFHPSHARGWQFIRQEPKFVGNVPFRRRYKW